MELQSDGTEVTVKLLTSGRYVWTITVHYHNWTNDQLLEGITDLNKKLKDKFPNHPFPGTGRIKDLEE